jgi:phosphoribosylanthranilate isomerase
MSTRVKICGIKTETALDAALEAGADYVGLVFFASSPRNVDLATARSLSRRAHERSRAAVVALLVDPDDDLLGKVTGEVEPDLIQLHGRETPERVRAIRAKFGRPIMKAVSVATRADVSAASSYLDAGAAADIILFDAKPPPDPAALPGGNGLMFDWHILDAVPEGQPFALAGGLDPDNVAAAIRLTGAGIVDVSSGVESAPGIKDRALIRRFIRAAKGAMEA